ncbi:MAG: Re/Si-specific NAD(P)(+) transhydrogenase subunit alpha [Planctomycetaceae bacterium]|nr:Re/Si-specific NAD(P)(+) transhydrogenase subunit alpha [Planctomycetaceae bacterium]
MKVGVVQESFPAEYRVALVPAGLPQLTKAGVEVVVQAGAGTAAGYPDEAYRERGAAIVASRQEVFQAADIVAQVRGLGANLENGALDLGLIRSGQILVGLCDPLGEPKAAQQIAAAGAAQFSLELIPRITRAQSMDVLSSMATVAGYKAVLMAADQLPKMFPMMMTAAGTITPAKVFVVGAGVAGLQAIASAKRLGAVVEAYDVRSAVKEQIESLGAKFVELPVEISGEGQGGYAKQLDEATIAKQREFMKKTVAANDVVITTAAVPGKRAPVLVTADMVRAMAPGSVIVDLAAERGGNCELTRAGQTVVDSGVKILGPTNLPATVPYHASQMYAKNMTTFLLHLLKTGVPNFNVEDEIIRDTLVTRDGQVVQQRVLELLNKSAS